MSISYQLIKEMDERCRWTGRESVTERRTDGERGRGEGKREGEEREREREREECTARGPTRKSARDRRTRKREQKCKHEKKRRNERERGERADKEG